MTSPWRKMTEAADYLRFDREDGSLDIDTTRKFLKKKGVLRKRGRALMVHVDDLETCIVPVNGHKRPA